MATSSDIQLVKDNIEGDASTHGFDDTEIARRLDLGQGINRVSAAYWRKRANDTLYLVNVSESGSSRALDSVYPRMVAAAERYEVLALADEQSVADPVQRLGSIRMKRA